MHDLPRPEVALARRAVRRRWLGGGALGLGLALAGPGVARGDHDHDLGAPESDASHGSDGGAAVSVGLSVEAAEYANTSYVGSYQGVTPSLGASAGRFGVGAAITVYHLTKNGLSTYGPGDLMLGAHAAVIRRESFHAGVALHAHAPTGSQLEGLGMGHVHAMPSAWASWQTSRLTLSASGGYAHAITALGGSHHDHDGGPLVAPMNQRELNWNASADLAVGHGLAVGGRTLGAVPVGEGRTRVIAGGRLAWGTSRVATGVEAQLGLVGDPFSIRGVVETSLRF